MFLRLDVDHRWTLESVDDFKRFKVVSEISADELRLATTGPDVILDLSGDAWVAPEFVTKLAGGRADRAWRQEFEKMVADAASSGWVDEAGRIKAHVE